jgi:hypothetical protein
VTQPFTYVTPFIQSMVQQVTGDFLVHTYTRQDRTPILTGPSADDDWGQPQYVFPDPVPGLSCYYVVRARAIRQPQGLMSANVPTLYVPFTDTLQIGDYVSDIYTPPDRFGNTVLLLLGPVRVETLEQASPNAGGAVVLQASLREIEIVQTAAPSQ